MSGAANGTRQGASSPHRSIGRAPCSRLLLSRTQTVPELLMLWRRLEVVRVWAAVHSTWNCGGSSEALELLGEGLEWGRPIDESDARKMVRLSTLKDQPTRAH